MRSHSVGFTLLEMSIVLVIIGLITGGIVAGKTMYRQVQINSIAADEQTFVKAMDSFRQKYGMMPGDFTGATNAWGAAGGNTTDNYTATCYGNGTAASTATCNGNGDGMIYIGGSSNAAEMFLFWKHLTNAGMLAGKYTGVAGPGGTEDHRIGTNCPASRMEGAGFSAWATPPITSNTLAYDGLAGFIFYFGGNTTINSVTANPIITAAEAYSIDSKYDDGSPAYGKIRTYKPSSVVLPNCATGIVSGTAAYNVTGSTGIVCSLIFITGF